MKNQIKIIIIATIINSCLFAQQKGDSIKVMKNEFGINVVPIVNYNNTESTRKPIADVFFKRQLKNNWYGRTSLILFNKYSNNYNSDNAIFIEGIANSQFSIEYNQNFSRPFLQYNLGIEKRFGSNRFRQFTGCDIGYARNKSDNKSFYGVRDSLHHNYPYNYLGSQNDSLISHVQKTNNTFILTPFYGMQINISKHFFFSAQVGVALSLINVKQKTINAVENPTNINQFDVNFNSVSSNFSICYRF
jgi:hypothetical protein